MFIYLERALKGTLSTSTPEKIQQFTKKFEELKDALDTGAGFQNVLVSSRILVKVETIGRFPPLVPRIFSNEGNFQL